MSGWRGRGLAGATIAVLLVAGGFGIGALVFSGDDERAGEGGRATGSRAATPPEAPPVSLVDGRPIEEVPLGDPESGTRSGSPLDDLPRTSRS